MRTDLFDIHGRKALVTGGTRGLGRGIAEGLMEYGAEVVIWVTSLRVETIAEEFRDRGFSCYGVVADLGSRDDLNRAFACSLELLGGKINILVNCTGIQRRHPSEDFPLKDWDKVLEVNLTAPFELCQLAGRGINVNADAPSYMATEMNTALLDPFNPRYKEITDLLPAHRWGDANGADMKGTCIFLASHALDYLNGAVIPVDGGYSSN